MFRDQRPPRHKGSFSLDFGRMGLRHEGKSLAWSSGGSSGLTDRKFRTTNLGSGLKVRRPRTIGQNLPIFDSFSSLFARVQQGGKVGVPVGRFVPTPGRRWQGRGLAFPKKPEKRLE